MNRNRVNSREHFQCFDMIEIIVLGLQQPQVGIGERLRRLIPGCPILEGYRKATHFNQGPYLNAMRWRLRRSVRVALAPSSFPLDSPIERYRMNQPKIRRGGRRRHH